MKREASQPVEALENDQNKSPNQRQKTEEEGPLAAVCSQGEQMISEKMNGTQNDDDQEGDVSPEHQNEGANEGETRQFLPPKCRIAMIVGYNGSDFCGSQKNLNVRTVEGELEKALFELGCINKLNFGDLKKIAWNRATRTDKSVHALQNTFSCKVHISKAERDRDVGMEQFRHKLNEVLRKQTGAHTTPDKVHMKDGEIKVFCVIEVSNRFNAKNQTSHRDYSYYLPTFLLAPISEFYLGKSGTSLKPEEQTLRTEDVTAQRVVNGITITQRHANAGDQRDGCESFMERDIKHLMSNPQFLTRLYGYRLSEDQKAKLHKTFKETFEGTKKYHNYTRDMDPSKNAANRYMLELTANDFMYVNYKTFDVTDASDPDALEFVHFFLKGQSFLYNQIRKMIGSMIQLFHGDLDSKQFLASSFTDNGVNIALAPGDGLMLEKVDYGRYNEFNATKKNDVMLQRVSQTEELTRYREALVSHIAAREIKHRAYIRWLSWFDDNCGEYFVTKPAPEVIAKLRGEDWNENFVEDQTKEAGQADQKKEMVCDGNQCTLVRRDQSQENGKEAEADKAKETVNGEETKPAEPEKEAAKADEQSADSGKGLFEVIPEDQEVIVSSKNVGEVRKFGDIIAERKPKLLAIYFSMHTCPPCRALTPLLAEIYNDSNEDEHMLEVVFLSGDKTQEAFEEYYGEMPWLAFPRGQKALSSRLGKRFEVKGVPRLVMLRASDGKCLSNHCHAKVEREGPAAIMQFAALV